MNLIRAVLLSALRVAPALLLLVGPAHAQHAGFRVLKIAGDTPATVALFYPTAVAGRSIPMGPWLPVVAPGAPVNEGTVKGLILISHGTGGTELNHHNLGTRLARDGYLAAAVRHEGDNWQDRSLVTSGRYLDERPRQLSRVLDALLASPEWGPRIPIERIGAIGHSAGGFGVLALAGARADPERSTRHCRTATDDPGYCTLAQGSAGAVASAPQASASTHAGAPDARRGSVPDPRIRAVVAMAPMGVVFTPESLASVAIPVRIIVAENDGVLNARYHAAHVVAHVAGAQSSTVAGAGHFAFMAQPTFALPSAAGDAGANPPGFDRTAYLSQLENDVAEFFALHWR